MEHELALILQEVILDQQDLLRNTPRDANLDVATVYNLHKIYSRFSSQFYFPSMPVYEDKEISEFFGGSFNKGDRGGYYFPY